MNEAVKKTISFFAIDQYPLTFAQLYQYLFAPQNVVSMQDILKEGLETRDGMVGGQENVSVRMTRFFLSERKMKKAQRISYWLVRFVPHIQMIAVCNHVSYFNADKNSDIDICIVSQKGYLYQTRFLTVLFLKLLGQRPTKRSRVDKICASFFLSEDALDLSSLQKESPDIYLLYWIATLWPMYEKEGMYSRFWKENAWIRSSLPHVKAVEPFVQVQAKPSLFWSRFLDRFCTEAFCKKVQMRRLPSYLKEKCNRGTDVLMNDRYLKFHANDRRSWYFAEWKKRYE